MIRPMLLVVLLSAMPVAAHAGDLCAAEAEAVQKESKRHGLDPALANPTEPAAIEQMKQAKAHHQAGVKLASMVATREQAAPEFSAAIDGYVAAALLSSAPLLLYNQAQVYRAAGDYPSAIEQYGQFIKRAKPRPALRSLIECQIDAMRAELERAASTAPPQGPAGASDPPTTGKAPVAATRPAPRPTLTATSGLEQPTEATEAPRAPPWHADPVGWGLTGGGLVVVGLGAYWLVDAGDLRSQARGESRDDVRIELDDKADDRQTWGTITTAAGAAILVTGIVKLAIRPDAPRSRVSLSIAPGGLVVAGRF